MELNFTLENNVFQVGKWDLSHFHLPYNIGIFKLLYLYLSIRQFHRHSRRKRIRNSAFRLSLALLLRHMGFTKSHPHAASKDGLDVLVTGHEDGSVKFWNCSSIALSLMASIKTGRYVLVPKVS